MVELLSAAGDLLGEARQVQHAVKFYEKGDRPLEIVTSRQWFFPTLALRPELLERGRQLRWHPPYMEARYASWVEGLNTDWLISRQRFFGVPFPVWYRLDDAGAPDYEHPLLPGEDDLPVDPTTDVPAGYDERDRGQPGGFAADPDVMDTWATSSLTPQIAGKWEDDPDLFARVWPMDLRPQAHDIIRTWLFATIVRSHLEFDSLPWSDAAISGWILDPDRKKMSKSKGNVVTPMSLLEQYGSDAVRYWAASARPGTDTAFDEGQMRIGRKLAIKVLNVSRFVLAAGEADGVAAGDRRDGATRLAGSNGEAGPEPLDQPEPHDQSTLAAVAQLKPHDQPEPHAQTDQPEAHDQPEPHDHPEPLDQSALAALVQLIDEATGAFEAYDYARALERTEAFFWSFCDDYVELVKSRAYGTLGAERARRARQTLRQVLSVLLRLLAPFLPYATEEVWSWWGTPESGSIHRARWPSPDELPSPRGSLDLWPAATEVLGAVRKAKTGAGLSLRAAVASVRVTAPTARLAGLQAAEDDLREAGVIASINWEPAGNPAESGVAIEVEFA